MDCWKLTKLQADNFRNLSSDVFEFITGINCILGENGNGKTNVLEAIYLLTNKKSFRKNTSYSQMVNIEGGKPEFILQSIFSDGDEIKAYSLRVSEGCEERFLNNVPNKGKTLTPSVFINPFDSYNFHSSSTFRRQWMDSHLSLMDADYKKILGRFHKAMRFRNSILGHGGKLAATQIRAIDIQVADYSSILTLKRHTFLTELNNHISPTYKAIFSANHSLKMELDSIFLHWAPEKIFDFYRHQEPTDVKAQMTQVGIHRDDFIFSLDGLNAFEFCSLGQQKMGFLSLIFAYIELFRYKFNSYPLVLIDDVSGELDGQRWKNLIQYLETKQFQVLITTANESFGKELERIPNSKKFYIDQGKLGS
jgi:DNA replication and repair protein RecF